MATPASIIRSTFSTYRYNQQDRDMTTFVDHLYTRSGAAVHRLLTGLESGNINEDEWGAITSRCAVWDRGPLENYKTAVYHCRMALGMVDYHPRWVVLSERHSLSKLLTYKQQPQYVVAEGTVLDKLVRVVGEPSVTTEVGPRYRGWMLHGDHPSDWCIPGCTWTLTDLPHHGGGILVAVIALS